MATKTNGVWEVIGMNAEGVQIKGRVYANDMVEAMAWAAGLGMVEIVFAVLARKA